MDTTIETSQVLLVDDQESLQQMADWLKTCSTIAVDTESDSLFVYYEKVCLIQFSAGGKNFIVDPLVTGQLTALEPIFASKKIEKIFHAAEYDIMCLKRDYNLEFSNLFDTMVAARILGEKEFGLGTLIENKFGIHLEKKFQKSNWGIRPLSQEMLLYATMDTQFLNGLRNVLFQELEKRDLLPLAHEDFELLCKLPAGQPEPVMINWWKAAGNTDLSFQQAGALQNLCELRETAAKKRDLPPFKIASNDALLQIALQSPKNEEEIRKIKGVPPVFARRYGKSILAALEKSKTMNSIPRPTSVLRPANGILSRKEKLKDWRKATGEKMEVPSDVILPKSVLDRIATENPSDETELRKVMEDCPWRYEHFCSEILDIIH